VIFPCGSDARLAPWRTAGWLAATAAGMSTAIAGADLGSIALGLTGLLAAAAGGTGLWIVRTIRYELSDFEFTARYGPWRRRVPLECIEGVAPASRSVLGFPRVLAYLTLLYRDGARERTLHLYPDDVQGLLAALVARAPFLERRGDHIVRTPALVAEL
jgi:hypothetical protein